MNTAHAHQMLGIQSGSTDQRTQSLLATLDKFVNSRPGFDPRDYSDMSSYRADSRRAQRQRADYHRITGHFLFRNVTADMILERAKGGRIYIDMGVAG